MRMIRYIAVMALIMLACSVCSALPVTRLGVDYLGGGDGITTKKLIDTGNLRILRTAVDEINGLIPYFKQKCPNGIVAVAMVGQNVDISLDPASEAQRRWFTYLEPKIRNLTTTQKAMINYFEVSPNMRQPNSVEEAQWWNTYAATLCPYVGNAGLKPMIFTIGVGGIPTDHSVLNAMLPALRSAKQYGGGWAYHGYTIHYTKDAGVENWYSLRYRQAYNYFKAYAPDLANLPLVIAEGGVDYTGNPETDGYAYRGSRERYADWLYWYDTEVKKDNYVVGFALFKIGGSPEGWSSFDLDPMVPWIENYLKTGQAAWPRPKTVLGACVLSEQNMSDAVQRVCSAPVPVIYADPSEVKPGGVIDEFKANNPNGIVIAGMRSVLPIATEPYADGAANKRWNAMSKVFGSMTAAQRAKINYVDATPGPVDLVTTSDYSYFSSYMNTLWRKIDENGFKPIIATFGPASLPTDAAHWDKFSAFHNSWKDAGKNDAAIIFQAGSTSYAKSANALSSGLLKYRQFYAYLLKYKPWMIHVSVFVMLGDGQGMQTIPDAFDRRPADSLDQFKDWLKWFDTEANKDPDVLGVTLFKFGAPDAYQASDLGVISGWYTDYIRSKQ